MGNVRSSPVLQVQCYCVTRGPRKILISDQHYVLGQLCLGLRFLGYLPELVLLIWIISPPGLDWGTLTLRLTHDILRLRLPLSNLEVKKQSRRWQHEVVRSQTRNVTNLSGFGKL